MLLPVDDWACRERFVFVGDLGIWYIGDIQYLRVVVPPTMLLYEHCRLGTTMLLYEHCRLGTTMLLYEHCRLGTTMLLYEHCLGIWYIGDIQYLPQKRHSSIRRLFDGGY
jgi:hypothetical protein